MKIKEIDGEKGYRKEIDEFSCFHHAIMVRPAAIGQLRLSEESAFSVQF